MTRALVASLALHATALALVWWVYREPVELAQRQAFDAEWRRVMAEQGK